jgi:hypothetical protein
MKPATIIGIILAGLALVGGVVLVAASARRT